jgi:protocatechuate 3,4-dioxygenase beta subunit
VVRTSRIDRVAAWVAALACLIYLAQIPGSSRLWRIPPMSVVPVEHLERYGQGELDFAVVALDADATGVPIAGARIRLFWADGELFREAGEVFTDAEGRAQVAPLPRGVVWAIVDAEGRARTSTQVLVEEEPRKVELGLERASSLGVRVVDDRSEPLADATVLVTARDRLPFGALTDARGQATFDRLGAGPYRLRVAARGYEAASRAGVTEDVTIALSPLSTLEVRVLGPSGEPAPGATVLIAGPFLHPPRTAQTEKDGLSRISGLTPGVYDLKARRGGEVSQTEVGVSVRRGEPSQVTLRLAVGRMVTARVTDGSEDPPIVVPNADVVLVESGLSSFPLQGRTNAVGEVSLGPLAPGPAVLGARADGFVPRTAVPVPDELDEPVRLPLVRGATLTGTVVDHLGRAVDGASIEVVGTTTDGHPIAETPMHMAFRSAHFDLSLAGPAPLLAAGELGVMPGPIPPIPGGSLTDRLVEHLAQAPAPWVTGYDGTFSAHPIPPGRVRALVRHPEYVEAVSRPVTLGPGGEGSVRVVLLAGGRVEGRVLSAMGIPIAGARVDFSAVVGSLERTTMTAIDGTFAFAAVPDRSVLSVARPEDPSRIVHRQPLAVAPGERVDVEVTLLDPREETTFVVTADGSPMELAQITVVSTDPSMPLRDTYFTDVEGVAVFEDVRGLRARITVDAPGCVPYAETFELGEEHRITLDLGVIVTGRVTAVRGRVDVEGAVVTLSAGPRREITSTSERGEYRFEAVAPGFVRIAAAHPAYAERFVDVRIEDTGRPDRPFEVEPIDIEEPGRVAGMVVGSDGEPVSGARVAVGRVSAYLPLGELPPGMVQTDAGGRFELVGLEPGTVDIEAYASDRGRGRAVGVEVTSGDTTAGVAVVLDDQEVDDELGSTGNVAITLSEGSGRRIAIRDVAPRSEALAGGLQEGDVLVSIDGSAPTSLREARDRLGGPEGTDVVLVVQRRGKEQPQTLTIRRERVRR